MRIRVYQSNLIKMVEQLCEQYKKTPTQLIISLIEKEAQLYASSGKRHPKHR